MLSKVLTSNLAIDILKSFFPHSNLLASIPLRIFGYVIFCLYMFIQEISLNQILELLNVFYQGIPQIKTDTNAITPTKRKFISLDVTFWKDQAQFSNTDIQGEKIYKEDQTWMVLILVILSKIKSQAKKVPIRVILYKTNVLIEKKKKVRCHDLSTHLDMITCMEIQGE